MKEASCWAEPAIDIENYYPQKGREKFTEPLIIVDPVDKNRNVAAVVSSTSLWRFSLSCRQFLQSPSKKFFFWEKVVQSKKKLESMIRKRNAEFLAIEFDAPDLVEDILWPQLRKSAGAILNFLKFLEFEPLGHYFWSDGKKCVIFIEFLVYSLPAIKKIPGPKASMAADTEKFISAHKNALNLHIEHERIVAIEHRVIQNAAQGALIAVKEPIKCGIPENFAKKMEKAKFLGIKKLLGKRYLGFVSDYYTRQIE